MLLKMNKIKVFLQQTQAISNFKKLINDEMKSSQFYMSLLLN
jgi:hypothetical protein